MGLFGSTNGNDSIVFSCASKKGSGKRDRSRCGGRRSSVSVSVDASEIVDQSKPLSGSLHSGV